MGPQRPPSHHGGPNLLEIPQCPLGTEPACSLRTCSGNLTGNAIIMLRCSILMFSCPNPYEIKPLIKGEGPAMHVWTHLPLLWPVLEELCTASRAPTSPARHLALPGHKGGGS